MIYCKEDSESINKETILIVIGSIDAWVQQVMTLRHKYLQFIDGINEHHPHTHYLRGSK